MMRLTDPLENKIEIDGTEHIIDLSYDNILRYFNLSKDDMLSHYHKLDIAFEMLVILQGGIEYHELDPDLKAEAVYAITTQFIAPDDGKSKDSTSGSGKRHYCLEKDAEFIYSSFLQEYGIDLMDQQGVLRWEKFMALLNGLRDSTRFKEIVGIRAQPMPKETEHNREERKRLRELKRLYALEDTHEDMEAGLDALFNKLAGQ